MPGDLESTIEQFLLAPADIFLMPACRFESYFIRVGFLETYSIRVGFLETYFIRVGFLKNLLYRVGFKKPTLIE